jgi:hypothetical protein
MTDFLDVLEQQLIAAHGRPQRFVPPWRGGMVLVAAAGAAAIIVAVVVGLASPDAQHAARRPAGPHGPAATPALRSATSLAVLNGTTVTGLARAAADKLAAAGYHEPNVVSSDATNQARAHSEVLYEPGHRAAAVDVARLVGVDRVRAMDANARVVADRAQVAVFIGADRAR